MTTAVTTTTTTPTYIPPASCSLSASASPTLSEKSLSTIAKSLAGLTAKTMESPTKHSRLFTRIERLVDSLARLVEAFANLKTASAAQQAKTESAITADVAASATTEQPSTLVEAATVTPQIAIEPSVDTTPQVDTITDIPVAPTEVPTPETTPTPEAPTALFDLGKALGKTGGFLWKPVSDKNGKLAVLIPKHLTGKIKEVRILSADGTKSLQKGHYSGIGNGDREHFRFSKPGGEFPDGAIVLIKLEDGTSRHMKISESSKRIER